MGEKPNHKKAKNLILCESFNTLWDRGVAIKLGLRYNYKNERTPEEREQKSRKVDEQSFPINYIFLNGIDILKRLLNCHLKKLSDRLS